MLPKIWVQWFGLVKTLTTENTESHRGTATEASVELPLWNSVFSVVMVLISQTGMTALHPLY